MYVIVVRTLCNVLHARLSMGSIPLAQRCTLHTCIPPISTKLINIPLFSLNLRFLPSLGVCFPYFYHDAFMHHALHVGLLDAPAPVTRR